MILRHLAGKTANLVQQISWYLWANTFIIDEKHINYQSLFTMRQSGDQNFGNNQIFPTLNTMLNITMLWDLPAIFLTANRRVNKGRGYYFTFSGGTVHDLKTLPFRPIKFSLIAMKVEIVLNVLRFLKNKSLKAWNIWISIEFLELSKNISDFFLKNCRFSLI